MDAAQGGEAPHPRTQVVEEPIQKVQSGQHLPEEPSCLRIQGPLPVDA